VNLLSNAVKFTDAGGRIAVACGSAENERVFVRVADTGSGIAQADLERIFDPFVQVANQQYGARRGTGLGLPISRRFARLMGGDLVAVSEVGKGSTFTLWLRR
jgi:signal transduction histidine kinase